MFNDGPLHSMAFEYNGSFHSIESFHLTKYEQSLLLIKYNEPFLSIFAKHDSFSFD